jgi:deoxyribose-phosphate aldolase
MTPADPSDGPHPQTGGTPFECGLVLLRAVRDYRALSGFLVGIKVPDCRTAHDALLWLMLVRDVAGAEWTSHSLLRLSGEDLLHDLQRALLSPGSERRW